MTSGDPLPSLRGSPQPVSDLVEVGKELQEERSEIIGREDTVEIKEALVDMVERRWGGKVKRRKRQDEVFCRWREWTLHASDSVLGSKNLLQPNILSIGSGTIVWSEFHGGIESS